MTSFQDITILSILILFPIFSILFLLLLYILTLLILFSFLLFDIKFSHPLLRTLFRARFFTKIMLTIMSFYLFSATSALPYTSLPAFSTWIHLFQYFFNIPTFDNLIYALNILPYNEGVFALFRSSSLSIFVRRGFYLILVLLKRKLFRQHEKIFNHGFLQIERNIKI